MDTQGIQVTASTSDGPQISLSPAMDFTMAASRGHVAVLLSIQPEVVREKISQALTLQLKSLSR